jgi:hypothetical protein
MKFLNKKFSPVCYFLPLDKHPIIDDLNLFSYFNVKNEKNSNECREKLCTYFLLHF